MKETVEFEEGALKIIARAADGSVRDGLSILDQSIAFSGKHISEEQVKEMIGLNDPTKILELIKFITAGQTQQSLEKINELYDNGADPSMIVKDLIETVHSLTMINIDAAEGVKSSLTDSEYNAVQEVAGNLDVSTLSMIWQMLNKGLHEVTDSFSPITSLEMLIIRIIYLNDIPKPNELISELNNMVEKNDNKIQDKSEETSSAMDPKVKEIIDFFPGTEVEQIEEINMNNFNNMIKQAQDLQKKMAEAQEKGRNAGSRGISGGGIVKITINGKNNVTSVNIDETAIDKNEKEILEDLIVAAFNDARDKIQRKIADEMSSLTGGIKLPPGMKLPF